MVPRHSTFGNVVIDLQLQISIKCYDLDIVVIKLYKKCLDENHLFFNVNKIV